MCCWGRKKGRRCTDKLTKKLTPTRNKQHTTTQSISDGKAAQQQRLSGTPAFIAPELVAGTFGADPFAADVWALGGCLYCFVFGRLPFTGGGVLDVFKAVCEAPLELPSDIAISSDLADLLLRLFDKNPASRIDVPAIMAHPWVTDGGRVELGRAAALYRGRVQLVKPSQHHLDEPGANHGSLRRKAAVAVAVALLRS